MPNTKEFLTNRETAALCRVTTRCIYSWVKKGRFPPPIRISSGPNCRRLLWEAAAVRQFLRKHHGGNACA